MNLIDVEGARKLTIDGNNTKNPTSVFISGPRGLCMEFDRADFVVEVMREFGLAAAFGSVAA